MHTELKGVVNLSEMDYVKLREITNAYRKKSKKIKKVLIQKMPFV